MDPMGQRANTKLETKPPRTLAETYGSVGYKDLPAIHIFTNGFHGVGLFSIDVQLDLFWKANLIPV